MSRMRGRAAACAIGLALVVLSRVRADRPSPRPDRAASTRTSPPATTPKDGGTLVIGVSAETDSWDPATAEWAAQGSLVGSSVLEPLAKLNADGGADPFLATSWIADANVRPLADQPASGGQVPGR